MVLVRVLPWLLVVITIAAAFPMEDLEGPRGYTFSKVHSHASEYSNINGDSDRQSFSNDRADLNGMPLYEVVGEQHLGDDDNEEATVDVILPNENLHSRLVDINGQEYRIDEPLMESDNDEIYESLPYGDDIPLNGFDGEDSLLYNNGFGNGMMAPDPGDDSDILYPTED